MTLTFWVHVKSSWCKVNNMGRAKKQAGPGRAGLGLKIKLLKELDQKVNGLGQAELNDSSFCTRLAETTDTIIQITVSLLYNILHLSFSLLT